METHEERINLAVEPGRLMFIATAVSGLDATRLKRARLDLSAPPRASAPSATGCFTAFCFTEPMAAAFA